MKHTTKYFNKPVEWLYTYREMQRLPDDVLYTCNYCAITWVNTQSSNHALYRQDLLTVVQPVTVLQNRNNIAVFAKPAMDLAVFY